MKRNINNVGDNEADEPQSKKYKHKTCQLCHKWPSFGPVGGAGMKDALFCVEHKDPAHVDLKSKRCRHPECTAQPSFGPVGGTSKDAIFCVEHKDLTHVDLKHKCCRHPGCIAQPSFGPVGGTSKDAVFCVEHKDPTHVDLIHKRCRHPGCTARPSFGPVGGTSKDAVFCVEHKDPAHVDLISGHCRHPGCDKLNPLFGPVGGTSRDAIFCVEHKDPTHVDLRNKRCRHPGCNKISPTFGPVGGTRKDAVFCAEHKDPMHVDLIHKRCRHPGCIARPSFGPVGGTSKDAVFCAEHKNPTHVNLVGKHCQHPDCDLRACFGIPGYPVSFCTRHANRQLHIKRSNARCSHSHCISPATHGIDRVLRHCEAHAAPGETDLVQHPCASCRMPALLNQHGKCHYCDDTVKERVHLAKQNALMQHLDLRGFTGISTDRMVDGGACGRERPDRLFESTAGNLVIILECDEHQHQHIPPECERVRMLNLSQAFGGTPVLFIRWNPDAYKPAQGKPVSITKRYETLCDVLETYINTPPDQLGITCLCSKITLFFDKYAGVSCPELVQ